ncbi:hypothetical protein KIN24_17045 [Pseudomonas lundensis]|uniref:hypothetical protein n=1 Tax=Pseudomonas lundensis TaxID=86185 RepID=UPI001BD1DB9E|nr:hypothetical protein [Pseudomonas lundensis]QVQ76662.1 hypothetical protein KIN24_17045 [Pseudomonas lundensis]
MNGFDDKPGFQIKENDTAKRVDEEECELLNEQDGLTVGSAHNDAQTEESDVSDAKMASLKLSLKPLKPPKLTGHPAGTKPPFKPPVSPPGKTSDKATGETPCKTSSQASR